MKEEGRHGKFLDDDVARDELPFFLSSATPLFTDDLRVMGALETWKSSRRTVFIFKSTRSTITNE